MTQRSRSPGARLLNLIFAFIVAAGVLYVADRGTGPVPPLGPAFVPGTGVWTAAADARLPANQTLHLAGLQHPAHIAFESLGTAHIQASSDHDLWLVNGYLHARFRLFEMDLLRRQGEGLLSQVVGSAALPPGAIARGGNSNNWAVNGAKPASGKPLLAGDPHLHQTLPAIWYGLSGDSPGYHFAGVGIPGTPGIIIGHNRNISWSLTNVQNQATFYYLERTRGHRYFWNGAWRPMRHYAYSIPVKGSGSVGFDVYLTVHGPVTTAKRVPDRSLSIWWAGALPSPDFAVLQKIMAASNFNGFRDALRDWHAPSQNFVYADNAGNIGLISAGYYPLVRSGAPWLPLSGSGVSDVAGAIPYRDIPQVYNPRSHVVFSANQRPVASTYPYYIGTSLDFFDNGYRANRIAGFLSSHRNLTAGDMATLQNDVHDDLAIRILPRLLASLPPRTLTPLQRQARALLAGWDGGMRAASPSASIWWTFWQRYLRDTFGPWWTAGHVPARRFPSLKIDTGLTSLDEDLEQWTLHDPTNHAFSLPDGRQRTAPNVMHEAFAGAVSTLKDRFGADPPTWRWGRMHHRTIESLAQIPSLQYGPRAAAGNQWTVNAADGGSNSTAGPSWRFIMDWGTGQGQGVYPGGQSENPLSAWYRNQMAAWWAGRYYPMLDYTAARATSGAVTWTVQP